MAGPEVKSSPPQYNFETLQERLKITGCYVTEVPYDSDADLTEKLPDGNIQLRLGNNGVHANQTELAEHAFVYDPERIEAFVEEIEPRKKPQKLRGLMAKGYIPLYAPNHNRLAAYRRIREEQTIQ